MNALTRATLALTVTMSSAALAGDRIEFYDYGRVIDATPIYKTVTHHKPARCHRKHHVSTERSATPTLVGGLIGGVIGNQFGGGSGKVATTIAGAAIGASIGHDATQPHTRSVSYDCHHRQPHVTQKLVGYDVSYRYRGDVFYTRTQHHPGNRIRLAVNATPVGH